MPSIHIRVSPAVLVALDAQATAEGRTRSSQAAWILGLAVRREPAAAVFAPPPRSPLSDPEAPTVTAEVAAEMERRGRELAERPAPGPRWGDRLP